MIPKRPILTMAVQVAVMRSYFPKLRYYGGRRRQHEWRGTMKIFNSNNLYEIRIVYSELNPPKVWITIPDIIEAPHRYPDESLCLYFPGDKSWSKERHIARTIVPWTIEWIELYEIWSKTGIWYGEEAPHVAQKI